MMSNFERVTPKHSMSSSILRSESESPTHFPLPIIHYPYPFREPVKGHPGLALHEKLWKLLNRLDKVDEHPTWNSCFLCLLFPLFVCFHQRSNEIGVEAMMVLEQSVSRGSPASKQVSAPAESSNALLHSASTHECPALLSICSTVLPLTLPGHSAPVRLCFYPSLTFN